MKQTFIILFFLLTGITSAWKINAQPLAVGQVVPDINMTDIHGNSLSLYNYLNQGYTVLIDVSATWCGPCWDFKQTGIAESLYAKYGPQGTVTPGKMMVLFIEGDIDTDSLDLKGTGSNTQGDWVTGIHYPIVDIKASSVIRPLFAPTAQGIGFPTFLMICPQTKKVIWNTEGWNNGVYDETFFVNTMNDCSTTGVNDVIKTASLNLYPNPVNDKLHLNITAVQNTDATLSITSVLGQVITQEKVNLKSGAQTRTLETGSLQPGVYMFSITTPQGSLQRKFSKY